MHRGHQLLLIATFLPLCWLGMQAVHELGHVAGAWLTGGSVARVVLHPLSVSRTELAENPSPRAVAWSGPLLGVLLPLAGLAAGRLAGFAWNYLVRFFAGFCLIANGAYLGGGSLAAAGDAGDLLRLGTAIWKLWLFAAVTIPLGLYLWHGLGPAFGLGARRGAVDRRAAYGSAVLLLIVLGGAVLWTLASPPD